MTDKEYILRLETALKLIASFQGKTLLGSSLGDDYASGHELGALKAFNQAAEIAIDALGEP